jgi:hypothetical protein
MYLWEDWNSEPCVRFVPIGDDLSRVQIDIAAREGTSFGLSESCQSEKFQEVRAILCVGIEDLGANVRNDCLELLECWCQSDWFLALGGAQMCRW